MIFSEVMDYVSLRWREPPVAVSMIPPSRMVADVASAASDLVEPLEFVSPQRMELVVAPPAKDLLLAFAPSAVQS